MRGNESQLEYNIVGIAHDARLAEIFLYDDSGGDPFSHAEFAQVLAFKNDCSDVKVNSYDLSGEQALYAALPAVIRTALKDGVELADSRQGLGQIFVFSGGNADDSEARTDYDELVSSRYTLAVGAIERGSPPYSRWYKSEKGASLFCVAPGHDMILPTRTSQWPPPCDPPYDPTFTCIPGTSMSAPCVAAVIALMEQAEDNLAWRDVMEAIVQSANRVDLVDVGDWQTNTAGIAHSYSYGFGLIDAAAAVNYVKPLLGHPAWVPLLGEREHVVALSPNGMTVGPDQTKTLIVEVDQKMRLEHVELLMDVTTTGALGIGPLEIEIDRLQLQSEDGDSFGGGVTTRSVFAVAHDDDTASYRNPDGNGPVRFTSVRHWGETATATWKVRLRNTSTSNDPVTATWNFAELRFYGTPKCVADWDMDTVPSTANDLTVYMSMHDGVGHDADLDGDRDEDQADIDIFTAEWASGCP